MHTDDVRLITHISKQPPVYRREIRDEGEQGLEYLELYIDALRHAIVYGLDDSRECGK